MMHFIGNEEEPEEENNRKFWAIILACAVIAIVFIVEIFIRFYLDVG